MGYLRVGTALDLLTGMRKPCNNIFSGFHSRVTSPSTKEVSAKGYSQAQWVSCQGGGSRIRNDSALTASAGTKMFWRKGGPGQILIALYSSLTGGGARRGSASSPR